MLFILNSKIISGYPSSHPVVKPIYQFYDIEQLFDSVETTKVASILRMIEYEIGESFMWNAIGVNKTFVPNSTKP